MDHPIIRKLQKDGFLDEDKPSYYDFFGRPIYPFDDYFELDGDKYLSEELPQDAIEILLHFGAIEKVCTSNTDK